jgi:adenylate cyclase
MTAEREHARADKVLYNVLPASIADELKRDDKVNAVKFDNMGVLFADIAGFTSFSRALPPEALVLVLNQIFSAFDALVERHGLEKIKTIGDAYMVVSHHRLDVMCELGLEMVEAMARYNRENGTRLGMRVGIHAGPAVAGVIGVKRFLSDVWGDTVNVASRMESTGEPGAVHVSDAVYAQTHERFACGRGSWCRSRGANRFRRTGWLGWRGKLSRMLLTIRWGFQNLRVLEQVFLRLQRGTELDVWSATGEGRHQPAISDSGFSSRPPGCRANRSAVPL